MTATAAKPNGAAPAREAESTDLSAMLEQVLNATASKRFKAIDDALGSRIAAIEEVLPDGMKGQSARLAKRAVMTLNRKSDQYGAVTPASFIRCVIEAAELGLAIDGRLAHAVVYKNTIKDANGRDIKVEEAQLQIDYKGLIAVARRTNMIRDCWARVVHKNDTFAISEDNGQCTYHYSPALGDPGPVIGAIAVVLLPDGTCRHEYMRNADIDGIRARSKSWKYGGGPWKTDDGEMRKKTVIRRLLKMYAEDPAVIRAIELDDMDYEDSAQDRPKVEPMQLTPGRQRITKPMPKQETPEAVQEDEPHVEPREPDPDELAALDAANDLAERLGNAIEESTTLAGLQKIGGELNAAKGTLGEDLYGRLMKAWQAEYKVLGGK